MNFELQHTDTQSNARAGLITTDHGVIETPIFMPVGTVGSVKAVHLRELKEGSYMLVAFPPRAFQFYGECGHPQLRLRLGR